MEKVRLTLDELHVQSFATTGAETAGRGTVRAHDAPTDAVECPTADPVWDTCWGSCGDTCGGSCGGTCDCDSAYCSDTCYWGCYTMRGMISVC
jgi:hypothetical protein